MEDKLYGIDKAHAHKRAIELVPEEFFWDCSDEFAPFGSDEGDMALSEFRRWRKSNPKSSLFDCLQWTIECVGEMKFEEYDDEILNHKLVHNQINDSDFDDHQYIFTLDISIIATGFGQLVDEGTIEENSKLLIQLAINRQKVWVEQSEKWETKEEYKSRLEVLERILKDV